MAQSVSNRAKSRVKRISIRLGSRQLTATFRRFRTRPENRSKRTKQYVVGLPLSSYREVAVVATKRRRSAKRTSRLYRLVNVPTAAVLIGIVSAVYFGLNLQTPATITLVGHNTVSAAPIEPQITQPKVLSKSAPMSVRIPSVNIETALTPVGLQSNGAIEMPDGFDIAGWYKNGPTPGELGPAVIVGHVDSTEGIAIFWRLRELAPGDKVYIDRQDGTTATFVVNDIQQYSQDNFPTDKVYGNIDHAGLRLITCGGTFSTVTGHYSDNTVVYASLE